MTSVWGSWPARNGAGSSLRYRQGLVVHERRPAPIGELDQSSTGCAVELSTGGVVHRGGDVDEIQASFVCREGGSAIEIVDRERQEPGPTLEVGVQGPEVGRVFDQDAVVAFEVGGRQREGLLGARRDQQLRTGGRQASVREVLGECVAEVGKAGGVVAVADHAEERLVGGECVDEDRRGREAADREVDDLARLPSVGFADERVGGERCEGGVAARPVRSGDGGAAAANAGDRSSLAKQVVGGCGRGPADRQPSGEVSFGREPVARTEQAGVDERAERCRQSVVEGAVLVPPPAEQGHEIGCAHADHFVPKWTLSRGPKTDTVAAMREIVDSAEIQPPVGPYSHAVAASGVLLFVSGQTGQDPSTGAIVTGGVAAETRQVLANLSAVLDAAGLDLASVVKCNVFLLDMAEFAEMNDVFAESFPRRIRLAARSRSLLYRSVPASRSSAWPSDERVAGRHDRRPTAAHPRVRRGGCRAGDPFDGRVRLRRPPRRSPSWRSSRVWTTSTPATATRTTPRRRR